MSPVGVRVIKVSEVGSAEWVEGEWVETSTVTDETDRQDCK